MPFTGFNPARNASNVRVRNSFSKPSGSFLCTLVSICRMQSFSARPLKFFMACSSGASYPCSFAMTRRISLAIGSLSTNTPSQSKIMQRIVFIASKITLCFFQFNKTQPQLMEYYILPLIPKEQIHSHNIYL